MRKTWCVWALALLLPPSIGCGGGGGGVPLGADGPVADVAYVKGAGGPLNEDAYSIATFADGSSVVTGSFGGTCTFGGGEPGQIMLTAAGIRDVYVARYDPDGTLAWAKQAGGALDDDGLGIDTVPDGSCIVTGRFQDIATFGPGEVNQTMLDDVDDLGDIFVARYNPDGTLAWAKRAGRNFSDWGAAVAAHTDGSCVITGKYDTIATFGGITLNAAGGDDIFVAAYHPNGDLAWARSAGSVSTDWGAGIDILADGSSLVTGLYSGPSGVFGLGDPNQTTLPNAGLFDMFVARYNPDGTLAWARRASGASFDEPFSLSAYADGGCVVGGFFRDTTVFGPGEANQTNLTSFNSSNDYFLARYAPDGSLLWARQGGGTEHGDGIRSVTALADGGCAAAGQFASIAVFDPGGPAEDFALPEGGIDVFVGRFDADGRPLWIRTAGGLNDDRGYGIAPHADGSFAVCGAIFVPGVFSPGLPDETPFAGPGGQDAFIVRYNTDGGL